MKKNHPNIIILYVPGGCTGIWQPLDVGIQRLLKLSIKRSAHRDIVEEALRQIKADKAVHDIKLDTTVGTLRDRSVGWVVQVINDLSDPAVIMRVHLLLTFLSLRQSNCSFIFRHSSCAMSGTGTSRMPRSPPLKLSLVCASFARPIRHFTLLSIPSQLTIFKSVRM